MLLIFRDQHATNTAAETNAELSKLADVGANNWVCHTTPDEDMLTKLYESPEFVRFGIFSGDLVLEHMIDSHGYTAMQGPLGKLMSTAMTTFFSMPSARSISLALSTFYHTNQAVAGVREVFIVHVGGTRCVTSSTDNMMKIQARTTFEG